MGASDVRPTCRIPFRLVIAPVRRQAELFIDDSRRDYGWERWQVRVATRPEHLRGYDFRYWEVWWLDRMWPCCTHRDVERMEEMMAYARSRGAKIRRWWT